MKVYAVHSTFQNRQDAGTVYFNQQDIVALHVDHVNDNGVPDQTWIRLKGDINGVAVNGHPEEWIKKIWPDAEIEHVQYHH